MGLGPDYVTQVEKKEILELTDRWPFEIFVLFDFSSVPAELTDWCRNSFGPDFGEWGWYHLNKQFPHVLLLQFKTNNSYTMFKLRWQ